MKWVDGNLISDSGHTCIFKNHHGGFDVFQHSLPTSLLTDEDKFMSAVPERAWKKMLEKKEEEEK